MATGRCIPDVFTSFVGREREIAEAKRLLASTHLLSLTGAGGCGKTRLSLQIAADPLDTFADGVWFVELAALTDPATLAGAIAAAMGISEQPDKKILTHIAGNIGHKNALLILDNCQRLLAACAEMAATLLSLCPNLRILTCTREALGIASETACAVPSLASNEAMRLFFERALAVVPALVLTEQNSAAITGICAQLDGIPLAIELAAARANVLALEEIAAGLNDSCRRLTGGNRTAWPQDRTLRAAMDWSHELLPETERKLLHYISIFAGGFSLEAAENVCFDHNHGAAAAVGDTGELLSRLVEKSFLRAGTTEHDTRYSLLDTIRQYSWDRLVETGEAETIGRRHRDYFLALAEKAAPELHGPDQAKWLNRLDQDHENFRAALTWCEADPDGAEASLRLTAALSRFWYVRGYLQEGHMWLREAMARAGESKRTAKWARALRAAGALAMTPGDYAAARSYFEESLAIFRETGDRGAVAATLLDLAGVSQIQGNLPLAQSYGEEALTRFRELGAARGTATALSQLGGILHRLGEEDRARPLIEESLRIFRNLNLKDGIAHCLSLLGPMTF